MQSPQQSQRRANRRLVRALLIMAIGSFAFTWAMVPLYGVFCRLTGIGSAEANEGRQVVHEAAERNRLITVAFVADLASVGSFEFRPQVATMRVHPGEAYATLFYAKNLSAGAAVARAVPSLTPSSAWKYFHRSACFCFGPQKFAVGEGRWLPLRFVVDPALPINIDRLTVSYTFFDTTQTAARRS